MSLKIKFQNLIEKIKSFVKKYPKLTILVIIIMLALYTFVSIETLHYTSSPTFCKYCHPNEKPGLLGEVYTWQMTRHAKAGVECLDCHGKIGFFGYLRAKMGGLKDVYGEFFKSPEYKLEILRRSSESPKYAAMLVPNETCLFCHTDFYNQKIRKETLMKVIFTMRTVDGVKNPDFRISHNLPDILIENVSEKAGIDPKHKTHQDKGFNCVDCHLGVVHGGQPTNKPKKKSCFDCHEKMSSPKTPDNYNCTACHRKEESMTPKSPIFYGKGASAVTFAHDTHAMISPCKDCHPKLFTMKKGEARISFSDHSNNKYCFNCHNGKKAFSWSTCNNCHAETPSPKQPIVYKPKDIGYVEFSHEFHASVFSCQDCHPKIWQMKRSLKKMTMDAMYEGKFCGSCHDGKKAFASTECDKCHVEQQKR